MRRGRSVIVGRMRMRMMEGMGMMMVLMMMLLLLLLRMRMKGHGGRIIVQSMIVDARHMVMMFLLL